MVELTREAKDCLMRILAVEQESNKGGDIMDKTDCLLHDGVKCTNCGKHETSWLICASEDGSKTQFLGHIPIGTGVTIKKE